MIIITATCNRFQNQIGCGKNFFCHTPPRAEGQEVVILTGGDMR